MNASEVAAAFGLFAVHWDEREAAITAAFEGRLDETGHKALAAAPDHDWAVLHLRFPAVEDLEIRGWSHEGAKMTWRAEGDRIAVHIAGPATEVRFTASEATIVDSRTSYAAPI